MLSREEIFTCYLADAVIDFAKKNLQDLRRGIMSFPAEPAPTGCVWIGDRCILPDEGNKVTRKGKRDGRNA